MKRIVIIGSGPAGVSAALYAARAGLETIVISKGSGALQKAEKIQNYYGLSEPMTGVQLEAAGIEGAKKVGVRFVTAEVVGLSYEDMLVVSTTSGNFPADSVIIATGSPRNAPPIPGISDFEGRGVSYCAICDAFFYKGKNVTVLGSGEYALHEIGSLLPMAASVTLATNGDSPSADFPPEVKIFPQKVKAVEGGEHVTQLRLEDGSVLPTDGVFVAYGSAGSTDLARKIGAATDKNRIVVDENMATNIPGLYAAGDCTGGLLQVAKAVYEGAKAATEAVKAMRSTK